MKKFKTMFSSIFLTITVAAGSVVTAPAAAQVKGSAYAILGEMAQTAGMSVRVGSVDTPVVKMEQGRYGWALDPAKATTSYIYVDVDDDIAKNVDDGTNFEVEVDYFDSSMLSSLSLKYPSYKNENMLKIADNVTDSEKMINEAEILEFRDSKSWRTKKWTLKRAAFNNFLDGADFSIGTKSTFMGTARGNEILIGAIRIKKLGTRDIADINISSKKTGNIFYTGEEMKFDIGISGETYKNIAKRFDGSELDIECRLLDYDGNLVEAKTQKAVFNTSKAFNFSISFNPEKYGVYMLEVEAKNTENKISSKIKKECSYVKSAYGEIKNPKSWINISNFNPNIMEKHAEIIKNAGFVGVRQYYHTNKVANTAYGENYDSASGYAMDFNKVRYSEIMKRAGLDISTYQMSHTGGSGLRYSDDSPYRVPTTDEAREEWLRVDLAIIEAMGGEAVKMYQIGNEWDIIQPLGEDNHGRDVARLLKYVYPRIKAIYPNMEIATGGICTSDATFWDSFIDEGGLENCDAICMHPYTQASDPISLDPVYGSELQSRSLKVVRKYLDDNGYKDMPIYASEYGYSARKYLTPGEYHQACWIMQQYLMYMQEGLLDRATLFQITCLWQWQEGEHQFGIIRYHDKDLNGYSGAEALGWVPNGARPSYVMMSALNHMMYDAEYVSRDSINEDTIAYRYKKKDTNQDVLTMFTRRDAMDVCYDLGTNEATYVDMYGNETRLVSNDGTYHFTATTEPFFVVGNFKKLERCYTAAVEPKETLISANYNGEYNVKVLNKTGESLTVSVMPNEKSTVEVKNIVQPNGTDGSVTLKFADNAYIGLESVPFEISGDKGIYYKGNLMLDYAQGVEMSATTEFSGGEWYLLTTLSNRDKQSSIKGTLNCITPSNLVEPTEVELMAGESKKIRQKITSAINESKINVSLMFASGEMAKYYLDTDISFVYIMYDDNITIDGALDEWTDGFVYLDAYEMFTAVHGYQNEFRGYNDIHAKMAFKYDEKYLYMGAEVYDDVHFCTGVGDNQLWSQDSIQLGISFDTEHKNAVSSFEEIALGMLDNTAKVYRHGTAQEGLADSTKLNDYDLKIVRNGMNTLYEFKISWKDLTGKETVNYVSGDKVLIGSLVNENDGTGRKGYYEFGGGIANTKNSEQFIKFQFIKE